MRRFLLVCLGGGLGSGARYLLAEWVGPRSLGSLPWGTLAVNVLGSFAIELVLHAGMRSLLSPLAVLTLATGFLGGFTTYSAFDNQMLDLLRTGRMGSAALYLALTLGGCLLGGVGGIVLGQALWGR